MVVINKREQEKQVLTNNINKRMKIFDQLDCNVFYGFPS